MRIDKTVVEGIKSHKNTPCTLEKYTILVGENNSGKSNILFSIRWFFNDVKLEYTDITHGYDKDPHVQIKFIFDSDDEGYIFEKFDKKYLDGNKIEIRAYCPINDIKEKAQSPKYQLIREGLEPKEIKKISGLADIIFVPSIKELSEEVKLTSTSTINKLVHKYIVERIKNEDEKSQKYNAVKTAIKELSDFIGEGEHSAFETLKKSLKMHMLDYGDVEIKFKLDPPDVNELIKNSFKSFTKVSGGELPLESQGMGFQRSLIFSLICNMIELESSSKLTLYLIEEPELFLHPNHQNHFRNKLIELSRQKNNQILLTSHSPYFLNNVENYSEIKRVSSKKNISQLNEISQKEVQKICEENGYLMANAKNECRAEKWNADELKKEANEIAQEDELRYLLWIDPNRANAFLSKKVILVEGSSEKALFSFLFNNPDGELFSEDKKSDIMVVDVNGKYHFYKFANLLHNLGIHTWILFDGDNDKKEKDGISHKLLNESILEIKSKGIIIDYLRVDPELEPFIGIEKDNHKADISMYHKLKINDNNCRKCENYTKIMSFVKRVISY